MQHQYHTQQRNPHEKEGPAKRRADWGLTKMRPWSSRYLVLRENVLYAYASVSSGIGMVIVLVD